MTEVTFEVMQVTDVKVFLCAWRGGGREGSRQRKNS